MSLSRPPIKTVNRREFQEQFEQLLNEVTHDNLELTIEEDGRAVAVLTPANVDERREARRRFIEQVDEMQQRASLSEEEAEELALEAVEAVRRARTG